jgi:hypothetical protein
VTLHRGKIVKKKIDIIGIRELTRDDLACLTEKRTEPVVQRLRDPHHALARLIATGLKINVAAERAGFSYSRALVLHADPSFKDLVESYRKDVNAAFVESQDDYYRMATSNMLKAERQLSEKLDKADEENELLPTRDLIAISRDAADRFGYGKKQTNVNINVDFAAKLEAARKRSAGAQTKSTLIEGNVVRRI